ncbi:GNAT family N-acetyltransferase [Thermococcus argininiproducens]|uniref:GNAT family N-acetyltransferase n=1 Tax=Thermococcus argininiproducens TaxID=2866384 RepID=A0A9E7SC82_9EURY|nr:GNAT family protein [Thermococcus argininiproducens]USG99530.1 GNAT family N-acetyltransferase [Thermococcus argininiproducens]
MILACGEKVLLRDAVEKDADAYLRWMKEGEWKKYDAPWEDDFIPADEGEIRKHFFEKFINDRKTPKSSAIIATKEDRPIGWVIRYTENEFYSVWWVGIDICEDAYLGKGYGSEALKLWVDYLFSNSDIHKIALGTYSFNKRMIKVAEKLGFKLEGVEREVIWWNGEWADRLMFGMLRDEWRSNL